MPKQNQLCDDVSDTALIKTNEVTSEWVAVHSGVTLFVSIVFNETNEIIAALTHGYLV